MTWVKDRATRGRRPLAAADFSAPVQLAVQLAVQGVVRGLVQVLGDFAHVGLLLLILSYAVNLLARQFHGWKPVLPALLWPLGGLMLVYSAVCAAWVAGKRGGLEWRGTRYPSTELRKGKRFRAF